MKYSVLLSKKISSASSFCIYTTESVGRIVEAPCSVLHVRCQWKLILSCRPRPFHFAEIWNPIWEFAKNCQRAISPLSYFGCYWQLLQKVAFGADQSSRRVRAVANQKHCWTTFPHIKWTIGTKGQLHIDIWGTMNWQTRHFEANH